MTRRRTKKENGF